MTSYDGYQWGAIGQYGWYFPYENQYYKGCRDPNVSSFGEKLYSHIPYFADYTRHFFLYFFGRKGYALYSTMGFLLGFLSAEAKDIILK